MVCIVRIRLLPSSDELRGKCAQSKARRLCVVFECPCHIGVSSVGSTSTFFHQAHDVPAYAITSIKGGSIKIISQSVICIASMSLPQIYCIQNLRSYLGRQGMHQEVNKRFFIPVFPRAFTQGGGCLHDGRTLERKSAPISNLRCYMKAEQSVLA